jgi:hypothetical protein
LMQRTCLQGCCSKVEEMSVLSGGQTENSSGLDLGCHGSCHEERTSVSASCGGIVWRCLTSRVFLPEVTLCVSVNSGTLLSTLFASNGSSRIVFVFYSLRLSPSTVLFSDSKRSNSSWYDSHTLYLSVYR